MSMMAQGFWIGRGGAGVCGGGWAAGAAHEVGNDKPPAAGVATAPLLILLAVTYWPYPPRPHRHAEDIRTLASATPGV